MNSLIAATNYQPRPIRKIHLLTDETGHFLSGIDHGTASFTDCPLGAIRMHMAWLTREVADRKLKVASKEIRNCPPLKVAEAYVRLGPGGWELASEADYRR
jgi:hypothetical protein